MTPNGPANTGIANEAQHRAPFNHAAQSPPPVATTGPGKSPARRVEPPLPNGPGRYATNVTKWANLDKHENTRLNRGGDRRGKHDRTTDALCRTYGEAQRPENFTQSRSVGPYARRITPAPTTRRIYEPRSNRHRPHKLGSRPRLRTRQQARLFVLDPSVRTRPGRANPIHRRKPHR